MEQHSKKQTTEKTMSDKLFHDLMEAVMELDPWPYKSAEGLHEWLHDESIKRGFDNWIGALHYFELDELTSSFDMSYAKGYSEGFAEAMRQLGLPNTLDAKRKAQSILIKYFDSEDHK